MRPASISTAKVPDLSWLTDVQEVNRALTETRPIWVSHQTVRSGPPVPHPEWHPYCEITLVLRGRMVHLSDRYQSRRQPGDLFLAGPGVPHTSREHRHPLEWVSVYFPPSLLFGLPPASGAAQILERMTQVDSPADRYLRPAPAQRKAIAQRFLEMASEFEQLAFGSDLRLRGLLLDLLVLVLRDDIAGRPARRRRPQGGNWVLAERALQYLHAHYGEPIYARDVAAAAGVSESALPKLFRESLGMPWVQYLQGYRLRRAAGLLAQPGCSVTDVALQVGFEDQSHFTAAFKAFAGIAPSTYARSWQSRGQAGERS